MRVYDTSGPYSDPEIATDIRVGLPELRRPWILARGDVDQIDGPRDQARRQWSAARRGRRRSGVQPRRSQGAARQTRRGGDAIRLRQARHRYTRDGICRDPRESRTRGGDGAGRCRRVVRRRDPRLCDAGIRARRDRPRPGDHPEQHQPPGIGADDHRPQLPGEGQRQYRQFDRHLIGRRGSRQAGLGDALGRRHGHGPFDRAQHPHDPRMDHPQLAGADRHGADLSGARKGRRQGRGADLGTVPRHADRAGRAGRRLFHDPCRRAARLHPSDRVARDRHRVARRLDHGEMVPGASQGEFPLHAYPRDQRDHAGL